MGDAPRHPAGHGGRFTAVTIVILVIAVALGTAAVLVGSPTPASGTPTAVTPAPPPSGSAVTPIDRDGTWKEIERLVAEQKYEEAAVVVTKVRESARALRNDEEWARSLIQEVQLRTALHGYETSVRFLRDEPWPASTIPRATLELFYARSLVNYLQAYGWEIGQRETVDSKGPIDLKAWTRDQIAAEATQAFDRVLTVREELGREPVGRLARFLAPNNYPERIRGTLRDATSYLFVELLADSSLWRPEQENDLYRLSLEELIEGRSVDPSAHPLLRASAILGDLETWHARRGEVEAAYEARLERLRRLHAVFAAAADRATITRALEKSLPSMRRHEWWGVGQSLLAEFVRDEDAPDSLIRAREIAQRGETAFPGSIGSLRCTALLKSIEAPSYRLEASSQDGLKRRSIEVTHKNLPVLYFRAYAVDLLHTVKSSRDYNLLPSWREVPEILKRQRPVAAWRVELPPTPDYREHRTFVTPPLDRPSLYVVVASSREDFSESANRLAAVDVVLGELTLVVRSHEGGAEITVASGRTGEAVPNAEVSLFRLDWQKGHRRVALKSTDASGLVRLPYDPSLQGAQYALVARRGEDFAADLQGLWFSPEAQPSETTSSLVYTDRSVYRPMQKIAFKVVAYRGSGEHARFATLPATTLSVSLIDANNQTVESKTVATNGFGSVAGEFVVPPGRLLGAWHVTSSLGGAAAVRVEEYKRPTFEVAMKDPSAPLRLNREARLRGEAKYYFGLPVVNGDVRWRVTREPIYPWWWWGCFGWRGGPAAAGAQTIAAGRSPLREDGSFELQFTPEADEREGHSRETTYRYAVSADVTDEGGETRSASRAFRLGFVSVEASVSADTTFFREGVEAALNVRRTDLDGTPKAGMGRWRVLTLAAPEAALLPAEQPLEEIPGAVAKAYRTEGDRLRERWNTGYAPESVMRLWPDGAEAGRGEVTHGAAGDARVVLPPLPPGAYRLRYETSDDFGAACRTQKEFVVAADRGTPLPLPFLLSVERASVRVGETARLLVHSGLAVQPLVLEIWRQGRRTERRELVRGEGSGVIEIPIGERDRGGFAVTLTALRDHQLMTSTQSVFVPWDDKELSVEFSTFRDKLRPGSKEIWRVTVKGPASGTKDEGVDRAAAELLAYMYDRSLDVFAPHQPPSVVSMYPVRTGAGWLRGILRPSAEVWNADDCFSCAPGEPPLIGDRLRFYDGYAIGGMGLRGDYRQKMAAEGVAAPASRAAHLNEREEKDQIAKKSDASNVAPSSAPGAEAGDVALRSNFAETAFWAPQLLTDAGGSASIEFTVPDSVTSWNVWVHAVTRDLRGGSLRKETKTVKELMVRPYLPRFLREGDVAEIRVVVNDAGDRPMSGRVELEILDPETNGSLSREFGLDNGSRPFQVKPGGGATVSYRLRAPNRVGPVAFKVVARSGDVSDGELRPLPLLPGRMHLAQSRFAALKNASRRELRFKDLENDDDPTRIQEQLVVTLDTQLFYGVLESLPYLVSYPYECTEQTLNRFLSTGIVSSLYDRYPSVARMAKDMSHRETRLETFDGADPNRKMGLEETPWLEEAKGGQDPGAPLVNVLDPRIAAAERASALAKLTKAQTSLGGFPWWAGGPPSPWMTLYILNGLSRALEFGVDVPKDVTVRAWGYLHRHYLDEWVREAMARDCCWESITFLNYVLSNYPDAAWTGGVFTDAERKEMLDFSFRHWREHSPLLKGYLTLTLKRMGRSSDASLVFDSVMDSAKTTEDEGTYWAAEDRSWLWYNDTIESHAFALRVLMELDPEDPRRDGLVQWLFLNKKLNHWKSTRATAEVIYALVHYLKKEGQLGAREEIAVTLGGQQSAFAFEPDRYTGKKTQVVLPGTKIDPRTSAAIVVEKPTKGLAFASATWMFSTEKLPDEDRGDFFQVSRRFYRRELRSGAWTLAPLAEGASLAVGDEIEVQISLRSKHEAEYVHLRDPRAAGFEPGNAVSRTKSDLGITWYEETRDSGTNFYFEKLPVGEYTFRYRVRAATAGVFKVAPATVQSMYAPEFNAYSAGAVIEVAGMR